MTDLSEKLGRVVREQQAREGRIEELAAATEASEIERELGLTASDVRAAFEPLSAEAKARLTAAITRSVQATNAPNGVKAPEPLRLRVTGASTAVSGRAPRRPARLLWLMGPAVAAAALVVLSLRPTRPPLLLDRYELEVSGSVASQRGAPPGEALREPLGLVPSSKLVLILRPERGLDRDVTARVYLGSNAGLLSVPASIERAPAGALKLSLELAPTLPVSGELIVLVGPSALLGDDEAAELLAAKETSEPGWRRLAQPFVRRSVSP